MNEIKKYPIEQLGYHFISKEYLPEGKDEYYLRNEQQGDAKNYRNLNTQEIDTLVNNKNTSDDWNKIFVLNGFNANLVKNCTFHGLVRIGHMEPMCQEFHNFRMPVGIYNSTLISCDIGNNVCIDNVRYLSHYIIADQVMLANIHELTTTDYAKFGNGIIKTGETERSRIKIEVCNENGARGILPFDGMLAGDAFLWSKYKGDEALQACFTRFTEKRFDDKRGYYGTIGERTVIKNCKIIKDVKIGSDVYIKGANKLKNLTINSDAERHTQIGEGCELVNGIIGYGCRIFYGVKAVRFILASHSQLKYGARLINSYLGNNSTISCCEVLNSLIFSAHEQHHNNSFLCAALLMGQSNMAAGATIGSNHNSRSADGELLANRGFWPGLCVSLKHNSRFASFTMIAKGDYPSELNIPLPFSLISNDVAQDRLLVMPAYWFMYNMYALARNTWKYIDRDKRINKIQRIEFEYLAPDTINEIFENLHLLSGGEVNERDELIIQGWENSRRPVVITKVSKALNIFRNLIRFYGTEQLIRHIIKNGIKDFSNLKATLPSPPKRNQFINVGGQLIPKQVTEKLLEDVKKGKIKDWAAMHTFYTKRGELYEADKLQHGYASLLEILGTDHKKFSPALFHDLLKEYMSTKEWMHKEILNSRKKDHTHPFRKMMYDTQEEMDAVIGTLEENSFIKLQQKELREIKKQVRLIAETFGMPL